MVDVPQIIETHWGLIPAPDPNWSPFESCLEKVLSDDGDKTRSLNLDILQPYCSDHTLRAFAGTYRGSLPFILQEHRARVARIVFSTDYDNSDNRILVERENVFAESEVSGGSRPGMWSHLREYYESYMSGGNDPAPEIELMAVRPSAARMDACRQWTYVMDMYPSSWPPSHADTMWVSQGRPSPASTKPAHPKVSAPDLAAVHLVALQHPAAAWATDGSAASLPTANILREIVKSMKYELPFVTAASTQRALSAAWMTLDALKTPYHVSDLSEPDNIIFPNCNTGIAQEQQGAPLPNMVRPDTRRRGKGKGGLRHLVTEFDCDGQEDFAYAERPVLSPREHLDLLAEHIAELADRAFASKVHYTVVGSENLRRSAFGIKAGQDPMDELQTEVMRLLEGRESSVDFKTTEEARRLNLLVECWHRHPDAKEILRENVFTTRVFPFE